MLIKLIERSLVYPRPSRERGDWRPRWLRPQNVWFRSDDIVLLGRSIGGGVAVAAAGEQGGRALVLEATFSRMTDAAANLYPWLPVRLVMSNRYNSVKRMQKYEGPLFQSHGADDEMVP